jgi:riboflavin biosynthesis pyrimidine reductase
MRLLFPEPGPPLEGRLELEQVYATPADPAVRANFVVSLDGAVEVAGQSAGLGGPADIAVFAVLRALADVVLVGSATVRMENYGPAKVAPPAVERRRDRGQAPIPTIAVVTGSANLDPASHLFSREPSRGITPPRPLILTCETAPSARRAELAEVAEIVVCGEESVDMAAALEALRDRGLAQVLCEGGPTLLTTMVDADLVDELCLTHSPVLAGPGRLSLMGARKGFGEDQAWDRVSRWARIFLAEADGLLFARYQACRAGTVAP